MVGAAERRGRPLGAATDAIAQFDTAVDRAIDRVRSPQLDHVFYALSAAADHSKLWHSLAWVRGIASGRPNEARRMSTALGIESFVTNIVVKGLFERVRPERPDDTGGPMLYGMRVPITSSFPSGHATAAFTAAVFLSDGEASLAPLWFGLAGAVAVSRVYVRMHHASDAVAGAALGLVLGVTLRRILTPR